MKKLRNNYTTPEQSKRLLEIGVPADSADCYYCKDANRPLANFIGNLLPEDVNYSVRCSNHLMYDYLPCWSSGRLIEIQEKCTGTRFFRTLHPDLLGDIMGQIEYTVGTVGMDFSKLEE